MSPVLLYDTFSRTKRPLEGKGEKINFFVCGLTVYDYAHIGHARTYITYDGFVKYLRSLGHDVFYLQNITDIDDKIIKRAKEVGWPWERVSRAFEEAYMEDMRSLGVVSVTKFARASEFTAQIINQIQRLQEKGVAYVTAEGNVYYSVEQFPEYGKLSRQNLEEIKAGYRIEPDPLKKHPADFSLWKAQKELDEPSWVSPWGSGRPGWHIEDTAITEAHFGAHYDIHGGGMDLIFPHHEAEIAQMEVLSGQPLVGHWMHVGLLNISGEKMSKSLKNFITIKDLLKETDAKTFRFFVFLSHYRSPLDFSEENLQQAREARERLRSFAQEVAELAALKQEKRNQAPDVETYFNECARQFEESLADDFNTAQAFASLFQFIREVNPHLAKGTLLSGQAQDILLKMKEWNAIFGFLDERDLQPSPILLPVEVQQLLLQRSQARKGGDFETADNLRRQIIEMGYEVRDVGEETLVRRKFD